MFSMNNKNFVTDTETICWYDQSNRLLSRPN